MMIGCGCTLLRYFFTINFSVSVACIDVLLWHDIIDSIGIFYGLDYFILLVSIHVAIIGYYYALENEQILTLQCC